MAIGAERDALLFRLFDCLLYVRLFHGQVIDRPLLSLDNVVKVDDSRVLLTAVTATLLRLIRYPLLSRSVFVRLSFFDDALTVLLVIPF